jgi:hypothetical protein
MIRQPTKESSVSVRASSVIPWIGGTVVLAIALVIVSSSAHRKGSTALPPPNAAHGRDSVVQGVAQPASKPNQPVAPAVAAVTSGDAPSPKSLDDTSTLKNLPASDQAPSAPERRATSDPKRDDNVQPASAVAPAPSLPSTPSAPATDASNTSAPSAVASSPGTVNSRGYYRMRRRCLRRISLLLPAEREPVERLVV